MNNDERRKAAALEADRILEEIGKPPESAPQVEEKPEATQQQETPEAPAPQDDSSGLKQEIARLQNLLDHEKQRNGSLEGRIQPLAQQYQELKEQYRELKEQIKAAPEPPQPQNDESYEQDVADFGEVTAKRMKADRERIHKLEAMVNDLSGTLKPTTEKLEQVERTSNQTAQDILNSALDASAPGWRQLNTRNAGGNLVDRGWDAFLDQRISEYSGQTFNDVLRERYAQGDVAAVAKIHNEYMQRSTSSSSTGQTSALDKHIDPSPTGGSGGTKNQKPTYTRTEYDKFMSDKRRGQTGLTSEEAKKKFDELNDALADGRVIGY